MSEIVKGYLMEVLDPRRMEIVPDTPPEYKSIMAGSVRASLNIISLSNSMYRDVKHTCLIKLFR